MYSYLHAIVYGIVQGLGEFLPISSSAHLIALPQILYWPDPGLAFDVALHVGTLITILAYFWKDWVRLIKAGVKDLPWDYRKINRKQMKDFIKIPKSTDGRLFWFIVVASIPGAIVGKLLEEKAETIFRNLLLIGVMLILMGILLYVVEKYSKKEIPLEKMDFWKSFWIGMSQALAIIPGVSRSGITMTCGLYLGLTKETAARFSFLLSTPIVFGAALVKLKDLMAIPATQIQFVIVGVIVSAVVGFLSIQFLLEYLKNKGFGIFVIYRIVVGLFCIVIYFSR